MMNKLLILSAFLSLNISANSGDVYTQNFQLTNIVDIVKCSTSDPNSRAYGATFLSVGYTEFISANVESHSEAKFVSNTLNGVFGSAPSACNRLPELRSGDGILKQVITLTASEPYKGKCGVIYREGLYLSVYGQELYGYDHGELLPSSAENCDVKKVVEKIQKARSGESTLLAKDKLGTVTLETTLPDAEGMCQKSVVTKSKKTGEESTTIVMPLSKASCG